METSWSEVPLLHQLSSRSPAEAHVPCWLHSQCFLGGGPLLVPDRRRFRLGCSGLASVLTSAGEESTSAFKAFPSGTFLRQPQTPELIFLTVLLSEFARLLESRGCSNRSQLVRQVEEHFEWTRPSAVPAAWAVSAVCLHPSPP